MAYFLKQKQPYMLFQLVHGYLLLYIIIGSCLVNPLYFSYDGNSGQKFIDIAEADAGNDAYIDENGVIHLTKNTTQPGSLNGSCGWVSYNNPISLKNPNTGQQATFITHFSFKIDANVDRSKGEGEDGLAFFISPYPHIAPNTSGGGNLCLYNDADNMNFAKNQLVAVEFDTFMNPELDYDDHHIRVNVNTIKSVVNQTLGDEVLMKNGTLANAWISYDTQTLSVYLTYEGNRNPARPGQPILSYQIKLTDILPNEVVIGFSAAAGTAVETHQILTWDFNSTLDIDMNIKRLLKNMDSDLSPSVLSSFDISPPAPFDQFDLSPSSTPSPSPFFNPSSPPSPDPLSSPPSPQSPLPTLDPSPPQPSPFDPSPDPLSSPPPPDPLSSPPSPQSPLSTPDPSPPQPSPFDPSPSPPPFPPFPSPTPFGPSPRPSSEPSPPPSFDPSPNDMYQNSYSEQKKTKSRLYLRVVTPCVIGLVILVVLFFIWKKKSLGGKVEEIIESDQSSEDFDIKQSKEYTYESLTIATSNFSDENKLGEGGFGPVFKGVLIDPKCDVAIKKVSNSRKSKEALKEYKSEVKVLSASNHRNIIKLKGWCAEKGEFLLVYKFMPNGSLQSQLYSKNRLLTWPERYNIALGLASALNYLHEECECCILHRDIKPENVLLDSQFNAKLSDFGLSRLVDHNHTSKNTLTAGTQGYLSPEYFYDGRASKESDIYSFGVVLLEIACGKPPLGQKYGETNLIEFVWDLYGQRNILHAADKRLNGEYDTQEMQYMLIVGLWCVHPTYTERPKISEAMSVLKLNSPLPNLTSSRPSLVFSSMDQQKSFASSSTGGLSISSGNVTRSSHVSSSTFGSSPHALLEHVL